MPGSSPDHDDAVHPVRPGADRTSQARRPELELPTEPVSQLGLVPGIQQPLQLGPSVPIGVFSQPRLSSSTNQNGIVDGHHRTIPPGTAQTLRKGSVA